MSPHVTDELPQLLTGEAPRSAVLAAAAHLRTCVDCQQELVSAVVAHASLSSAHRFAPEVVGHPSTDAVRGTSESAEGADRAQADPLPDLSAIFAQVREEAASPSRRPGSRRTRLLLAGVAAAVVVGGRAVTVGTTVPESKIGQVAVLGPARRAALVPPVVATRAN